MKGFVCLDAILKTVGSLLSDMIRFEKLLTEMWA